MTNEEHRDIIAREERGEIIIGIDRVIARRFFINMSHAVVQSRIGEPVHIERGVVWSVWLLAHIAPLFFLGLAIFAFKWWSLLIIPVMVLVWLDYYILSPRGDSKLTGAILFLILAIVVFFLPGVNRFLQFWFGSLAVALFLIRFTYIAATELLRAIVFRNARAFELLYGEGIVVQIVE